MRSVPVFWKKSQGNEPILFQTSVSPDRRTSAVRYTAMRFKLTNSIPALRSPPVVRRYHLCEWWWLLFFLHVIDLQENLDILFLSNV